MREFDRRSVLGAIPAGFLGGMFQAPKEGKPAPAFTLTGFDGRKTSLADLAGKVVVLNFWAFWCTPCRAELPMFNVYVQERPNPDLKLFAVAADDTLPTAKLKVLSGMVVFPLAKSISNSAYGPINNALPSNFVIDRGGILRYAKPGAFDADSFGAVVEPLLAEAPPTATSTSA